MRDGYSLVVVRRAAALPTVTVGRSAAARPRVRSVRIYCQRSPDTLNSEPKANSRIIYLYMHVNNHCLVPLVCCDAECQTPAMYICQ